MQPALPRPEAIYELDARMSRFLEAQEKGGYNPQVTSLKLQLTQASMCHEYSRMEYAHTVCVIRRGELMDEMGMYQSDYLEARTQLERLNPSLLLELESELRLQKQLIFGHYHA